MLWDRGTKTWTLIIRPPLRGEYELKLEYKDAFKSNIKWRIAGHEERDADDKDKLDQFFLFLGRSLLLVSGKIMGEEKNLHLPDGLQLEVRNMDKGFYRTVRFFSKGQNGHENDKFELFLQMNSCSYM